jgi:hypothetical protein
MLNIASPNHLLEATKATLLTEMTVRQAESVNMNQARVVLGAIKSQTMLRITIKPATHYVYKLATKNGDNSTDCYGITWPAGLIAY